MTHPIEKSNIPARKLVAGGSRYINQPVIYYGEKRLLAFELYNRRPYKKTGKEKVTMITMGFEYRPDLVSYDYYGYPDNWWLIMQANRIYDIIDFKAGRTIFLPDVV